MTFGESISTCFKKYVEFNGRAGKAEFWWFCLFTFVVSLVLGFFSQSLSGLFSLAVMLPSLAVGARRLHDTDRSAWFLLLWLIPLIGWIILLVFAIQDSVDPNRYGGTSTAAPE